MSGSGEEFKLNLPYTICFLYLDGDIMDAPGFWVGRVDD
jgi:hypothetical protein